MRGRLELGLIIDRHHAVSLQHQLRLRLIEAMNRGILRPGRKLPSSRVLAAQVGVARNTVTLAYEALIAEGHLVTRPRSGIFVARDYRNERVTTGRRGLARTPSPSERLAKDFQAADTFIRPPNWQRHPYPFLEGCVDETLAPVDEWREALKLAFSRQSLTRWSSGASEDDVQFLDELRATVLPAFGVSAAPDEVVAASSVRHALHLAAEVLIQRTTPVLFGAGVDEELRRVLQDRQTTLTSLARDADYVRALSEAPEHSVIIIATPSTLIASHEGRQRTNDLLAAAAAREAIIIEYAPPPDVREDGHKALSLRALDESGRVVFVTGLSCLASSGAPPGLICADAQLTARVRQLKRLTGTELAPGLQRAWAYFIGLGHYAACLSRASRVLQSRRTALRDGLNHYLSKCVSIQPTLGSSAYSVKLPQGVNAYELARAASTRGVLIEPDRSDEQGATVRMGVTSLTRESIRSGVEVLARVLRGDHRIDSHLLRDESNPPLDARTLQRALSGATLLYNTVYGDPCTIEVRADGSLAGRAGFANEDCDTGRWWIEGDRWFRQWNHWSYGETVGFITTIDGDQVRWFNTDGVLRDTALIVRRTRTRKR